MASRGQPMRAEDNERITQVGPGTPAGNMPRRYLGPVMPSAKLTNKPVKVRLLGEKFVLFRSRRD